MDEHEHEQDIYVRNDLGEKSNPPKWFCDVYAENKQQTSLWKVSDEPAGQGIDMTAAELRQIAGKMRRRVGNGLRIDDPRRRLDGEVQTRRRA